MSDKICKLFKNLKKDYPEKKITLITYKHAIKGYLDDTDDDNSYEGTVVLKDVEMFKLKHMCPNNEEELKSIKFKKLYIALDKLLAMTMDE